MANYTTAKDLIDDALQRANEPTGGASEFQDLAIRLLNRAYQELWTGGGAFEPRINESWWWLRARGQLLLEPQVTSGTVSVTQGSDAITFSSAITTDLAGYHFQVDGHPDVFVIDTHGGSTDAATLDTVYTGDTESEANYQAFKVDYDLAADVLSLMHPMQTQRTERSIHLIGLEELHEAYPLTSIRDGVPDRFAMLDETKVRFNRAGDDDGEQIRVDYHYLFEPDDLEYTAASVPSVPRQYRKVLADMVVFWLLVQKNDERANGVGKQARAGIRAMVAENRRRWALQANMGVIRPRDPRHPGRPADGPVRTESGMILG